MWLPFAAQRAVRHERDEPALVRIEQRRTVTVDRAVRDDQFKRSVHATARQAPNDRDRGAECRGAEAEGQVLLRPVWIVGQRDELSFIARQPGWCAWFGPDALGRAGHVD